MRSCLRAFIWGPQFHDWLWIWSHFKMPYSEPEQSETKLQTDRFGAVASAGTFVSSQCKRYLHMRTIPSLKLRNCIQHSNMFSLLGYLHVPFSYDYDYPIPKHYLRVHLQVIRIPGRPTPLLIFSPSWSFSKSVRANFSEWYIILTWR